MSLCDYGAEHDFIGERRIGSPVLCSATQLVAQMPGTSSLVWRPVLVKNGASTSNAVAVIVPTASPEIDVYGNNLAVATFTDYSVITSSNPAKVGDTVVLWFTGGGPVNASGKLTTGAASPAGFRRYPGRTPLRWTCGCDSRQLRRVDAGSIGLYQANIVVPSGVASGSEKVVLTISGQASNAPLLSIK